LLAQQSVCWIMVVIHAAGVTTPRLKNFLTAKEREALLRKARQLKNASQINQWLSSPALKPPE